MTSYGFQDYSLTVFDSLHNNLRKRHVGEFEFPLVLLLFKANIENINRAAEWSDSDLWTVTLPSDWGYRVVVLNLFAADLIPLRSLSIEVVNVEPIKVSHDGSLPRGIKRCACEFFDLLILGVVKSLETITCLFVEVYLSIVTASENVGAPWESIGDGGMLDLWLSLSVDVEG